ncbi:hypothetical protein PF003_g34547 [Phytophthora fragariae]|nr:hypothetical protein PF003_g34547 [Phytophthora fragariae]
MSMLSSVRKWSVDSSRIACEKLLLRRSDFREPGRAGTAVVVKSVSLGVVVVLIEGNVRPWTLCNTLLPRLGVTPKCGATATPRILFLLAPPRSGVERVLGDCKELPQNRQTEI